MKKIVIITGTRADYGIYRPVAKELVRDGWDVSFLVSGMHLVTKYGYTMNLIEKDGFRIVHKVDSLFLENTRKNMARTTAIELNEFADNLSNEMPDFVLILGDRGEMLAAAVACLYLGIKCVHLHGGEVSGTVDESIRHAISKLSNVHLVATEGSKERLIKMGEESWRINVVGAPRIDSILNDNLPDFDQVAEKYNLMIKSKNYILQLFHPVVTEYKDIERQVDNLIQSVKHLEYPIVCILPNSDAGGDIIRKAYQAAGLTNIYFVTNFEPDEYLIVLKNAKILIGNSSSGIIEAASYGIPVVNIGSRQIGRERSENIIDTGTNTSEISGAIKRAITVSNSIQDHPIVNVYGDGNSSKRVRKILNDIMREENDEKWLKKRITY
ncbi:UDP-N-acetylglucosamine 2-epimerase [Enterococcus raffinosus]|uniref:UDP-N-acetylglucosamine 2-epimerase n=1 Tax=Enterococcus raffinosus TaxID=71452 RepID=UPI00288F0D15|nr:UDP-N-acetylglucosamine 2-epimerase [Enterococcus raffinosus]MDT2573629.1 UDP-N-acetylglucosamine 2-epimerase [Enterococcus raffinosus]